MKFYITFVAFFYVLSLHPDASLYLSENTWRNFCNWRFSAKESFDPRQVKVGDTIFISDRDSQLYKRLQAFEEYYLPFIKEPCILITPRTDSSLPGPFAHLLLSENIHAWFVQNIDQPPSKKLYPIPIGLPDQSVGYNFSFLQLVQFPVSFKDPSIYQRNILVYVNLSKTHEERQDCLEYFSTLDSVVIEERKPLYDYLSDLHHSVFVVSPQGAGLACHRTWEALILGAYPIVKHSPLDPLFENLPVVLVNEWKEVTQELLLEKKVLFDQKTWTREKLFSPYWLNKVAKMQQALRKDYQKSINFP